MNRLQDILNLLPYSEPFLFVDGLDEVSQEGITGHYIFKKDAYFYEGHFKGNPVTPGVILTECMAQIGVVCLGIYLLSEKASEKMQVALSSTEIDFYKPVFPGERVSVISEKEYFRFGKLKCKVKMLNEKEELVCKGVISGMVLKGEG
ncbi:3-hydroxyacyl-[acyl-carrier-protein] dehydratase [Ulvibacter sp. MAR_2010_11]|uniref:3-hydroxyacyl-ACP dehydratase FabZ family protein n=1 Tax=Ulvibacter sp. MAR_2010_11 TaxID=1250229 RepID=UPI000C2C4289|nr:beta-hydroxyacyl-ACP dehydratase [Ulvibacter sp. MAR_2010_11]PKA84192.1 3-hydroxyacyl-[acyl-carrier-protein] dehydratase [Ulvibacter sp. MAR_2010_11]